MEIRYGIEDISSKELMQIKNQIINNGGFIYVEDIKFFIEKLPLKINTLNEIVFKLFGKENIERACWGPGSYREFFKITSIAAISQWEWANQVGYKSQWSRRYK